MRLIFLENYLASGLRCMKLIYFIAPLPYTVLQIQWYLWKILLTHINSVSSQGSLWKFHTGLCCALITPTLPSPSSSAFLLPQRFPSHSTTVPLPFQGSFYFPFRFYIWEKIWCLSFWVGLFYITWCPTVPFVFQWMTSSHVSLLLLLRCVFILHFLYLHICQWAPRMIQHLCYGEQQHSKHGHPRFLVCWFIFTWCRIRSF